MSHQRFKLHLQISLVAFGMLLAFPFALTNPNVGSIDFATTPWFGEVKPHQESTVCIERESRLRDSSWKDHATIFLCLPPSEPKYVSNRSGACGRTSCSRRASAGFRGKYTSQGTAAEEVTPMQTWVQIRGRGTESASEDAKFVTGSVCN